MPTKNCMAFKEVVFSKENPFHYSRVVSFIVVKILVKEPYTER